MTESSSSTETFPQTNTVQESHQITSLWHRFEILCKVAEDFFDTNMHQQRQFTLNSIIEKYCTPETNANTPDLFSQFLYYHLKTPYIATIVAYEDNDGKSLHISLTNGLFQYVANINGNFVTHRSLGQFPLFSLILF